MSRERKRETRNCAACGRAFETRADSKARSCSIACSNTLRPPVSDATRAKRSASLVRSWASLQDREGRGRAIAAGINAKLASDPEARSRLSSRMSAWMHSLHQDPAFCAERSKRSSRVLKKLWEDPAFRAAKTEEARARYEAGIGISDPESILKQRAAGKWIYKRCHEEMIAATDYAVTYARIQARIRMEKPYDGPQSHSDYQDYLRKLGQEVVSDPELRAIQDAFMREAIPRWANEWQLRKQDRAHNAHEPWRKTGT